VQRPDQTTIAFGSVPAAARASLPGWFVPAAVFATTLAAMVAFGLFESAGRFAYPLDDTYIHMAIARTLADSGVWGMDASEFVSGSSSMAWTMLLAIWFKIGGGDLGPLLINIPLALATLVVCDRVSRQYGASDRTRLLTGVAVALATPLPLLALMGMEHALQTFAFVLFLAAGPRYLERKEEGWLPTLALLALMTAIRPEGMFAAAIFVGALFVRRDFVRGLVAGVTAAAPLVAFAAYSLWNGAYALPNSVLVKAGLAQPDGGAMPEVLGKALPKLLGNGIIFGAVLVSIAVLVRKERDARWNFALLWLGTALLHVMLAPFGWLYRYEAYLVASGVLLIGLNVDVPLRWSRELQSRPVARALAYLGLALMAAEAMSRVVAANWTGATAMRDRLYENVLSAEFVQRYYDDEAVLANDIGAIAYLSHAKVLDFVGLGSNEPIAFRRDGTGYDASDVERWAWQGGARVALVKVEFEPWRALIPKGWRRVVTWRLPRNNVFNDHLLSFYARDEASARQLESRMREFAGTLPPGIELEFHGRPTGSQSNPLEIVAVRN
jgi:hypothetical protein